MFLNLHIKVFPVNSIKQMIFPGSLVLIRTTQQPTIAHLTRSSLHLCLQRHGISCLPEAADDKPVKKRFKTYPVGYFHIDIAEVRTAEGKLYLFFTNQSASSDKINQLYGLDHTNADLLHRRM